MTRYRQLAKVLRAPRGTKTAEHLDNLRKSDPLINLPAWLDMRALSEGIKTTAAYKAHQRGLRARASHARTSEAPRAASLSVLTQTMPTVHEEGSEEVDTTYNSRGERRSSVRAMRWHQGDGAQWRPMAPDGAPNCRGMAYRWRSIAI